MHVLLFLLYNVIISAIQYVSLVYRTIIGLFSSLDCEISDNRKCPHLLAVGSPHSTLLGTAQIRKTCWTDKQ